jgi:hypothetical protein
MMGIGVGEMIILFGLLGGFVGTAPQELKAPHDSAQEAVAWVLPDAHVVAHVNVEATVASTYALLDEIEHLALVEAAPDVARALRELKASTEGGLTEARQEVGVDVRSGVGNVTFSAHFRQQGLPRMLMRARGSFSASKVTEVLAGASDRTTTIAGKEFRVLEGEGDDAIVVGLVDETTLLLGAPPVVEAVLGGQQLPSDDGTARGRLSKMVGKKTMSFLYLAPPGFVVEELRKEPGAAKVAELLQGTEWVGYTAGVDGGLLRFAGNDERSERRIELLMRSASSLLSAFDPLTDAVVYGAAALLPLVAEAELGEQVYRAVSNEKAMLGLGEWLKKRFGGKSKVTRDAKKHTVDLSFSNPSSVTALAWPVVGGAAFWGFMAAPYGEVEVQKEAIEEPAPGQPVEEPIETPIE